jgi:hypothetical protein
MPSLIRTRGLFSALSLATVSTDLGTVLRTPIPGPLFGWAKLASYIELALFAGLLVVWLAPGFEHATFYFGLAHGIGFIVLALVIWAAVLRHEAPYTLLAATLTPVGPVGSVIAIHYIEKKVGRDREGGHAARPTAKTPLT